MRLVSTESWGGVAPETWKRPKYVLHMKLKQIIGLVLGGVGFLVPLMVEFPGLGFAGQITLGIFILAACFWVTEPVPIYTTSLLVIFLEVLLLSKEGPISLYSTPPTETVTLVQAEPGGEALLVPTGALVEGGILLVKQEDGSSARVEVTVLSRDNGTGRAMVQSEELKVDDVLFTDPDHWLVTYRPTSYATFFAAIPVGDSNSGMVAITSGSVEGSPTCGSMR